MTNHEKVSRATDNLIEVLAGLDISSLNISVYYSDYLKRIQKDLLFYSNIYKNHILYALKDDQRPVEELSLLDYGAGCGLLSILAKKAGFKNVICNDIYEVAVQDARVIASHIGDPADQYLSGDIAAVRSSGLRPDLVVGMDVIEHIYDLEEFFRECSLLNDKISMCFGTGSNPYNPVVANSLKSVMNQLDETGSGYTSKERDSREAYSVIRKNIISGAAPTLRGEELDKAVRATRGMNSTDILKAVSSGVIPERKYRVRENTCDPLTGNWAERLLYEEEYENIASKYGFRLSWFNGVYNCYNKGKARTALLMTMNAFIRNSGHMGRRIAPYAYLIFRRF